MIGITRLLRGLVGAAFIAAGVGKLMSHEAVRLAPILLRDASGPMMIASTVVEDALPVLEILAGLAAWVGIGRMARTLIGLILGSMFVAVALLLPEGSRCGCLGIFGSFESRSGHVVASASLLACATLLGWLESRKARRAARYYDATGYDRPHRLPEVVT